MALHKVPGSRRYLADDKGFAELAMSTKMGDIVFDVADRIAGNANAVGESEYEAVRAVVKSGRQEREDRRGAYVNETERHWKDGRDEILVRVTRSMNQRRK